MLFPHPTTRRVLLLLRANINIRFPLFTFYYSKTFHRQRFGKEQSCS